MYTRRVIPLRRRLPTGIFVGAPFSPADIGLSSFVLAAIIAIWYIGDFHTFHHSDTAIFALSSLYRWTPFAWEYDHIGSLLPLLASFIHRPYMNLLALSSLNSFALLGGLVLWVSMISFHQATLLESSLWVSLLVPLVMPKSKLFENAAYNYPWGLGFFFASLFTFALQQHLRRKYPKGAATGALTLLAFAFLTVYVSKISVIPLLIVTPALIWQNLNSSAQPGKLARQTFLFYSAPLAGLTLALLIYQTLEVSSEFRSTLTLNLAFVPLTLPSLLKNWASQELTTPLLLLAVLPALLYHLFAGYKQNPLFIYLAFGVMAEALIVSSSIRAVRNHFTGIYLTDLTFLLLLLLISTLSSIVQRLESVTARWSLFAVAILLSLHLNLREWNSFSPIGPFAAMERASGATTPALVEAKCDIVAGDYWRVWPAVLAVNDYYYRENIFDPRTHTPRLVAGLAYRAWPTEYLWRPRLSWPEAKLCSFADDEMGLREALGTYAPELALLTVKTAQFGNVVTHEIRSSHFSSLAMDFNLAAPGSGWGAPELSPTNETFIWMNAAESALILPLDTAHDLNLEFRILYTMAPDITQSLTLAANGQPIPLTSQTDDKGGVIFSSLLPQSTLALAPAQTHLIFHVNRTLIPLFAIPNSLDTRPLALAFDWLKIDRQHETK